MRSRRRRLTIVPVPALEDAEGSVKPQGQSGQGDGRAHAGRENDRVADRLGRLDGGGLHSIRPQKMGGMFWRTETQSNTDRFWKNGTGITGWGFIQTTSGAMAFVLCPCHQARSGGPSDSCLPGPNCTRHFESFSRIGRRGGRHQSATLMCRGALASHRRRIRGHEPGFSASGMAASQVRGNGVTGSAMRDTQGFRTPK